ncbi:hypothetical protein [Hydrocarboniclastica marina]|uniref:DUF4365 domain-containing protein n=1 Tax=Hydrocarboniclastica marina TaxID=2259620 RepID=A0A4P7XMY9_9ALTE|nr:hypothetical protein [Hydrocarboniclastica marina]QCF27617.1 hypothetical protein soil367_17740 [Hydrocarboniclastica marina]
MKLERINYKDLNARAQETYNFHKIAAVLADYGYNCIWLSNDWNGADFIAVHVDGVSDIKVQLKGCVSFAKKYRGKNLYIGFYDLDNLYLYPHDLILDQVEQDISDKKWLEKGTYFRTSITKRFRDLLEPYKIANIS